LSFGIGAMIASLHDVLITLSFLTFFGYELSLNVVAAILTLVGYGVNDQIVIFDRVRENLRTHRRESLDHVINTSVNQTLPRTVITAGTTFLSVLALYVFGGEVLEGFAFAMLVGIVTSTYSTVFIASAIAVMVSKRKVAGRVSAAPAATAPTPAGEAISARKKARKAKAS
jgi:preprotein translocase subunit SecF